MVGKPRSVFVCQSCGQESPRWMGRCSGCGAWNSYTEEREAPPGRRSPAGPGGREVSLEEARTAPVDRTASGLEELDRVLGGGFVPGSLVLLGGDPGIGKSTLLLQAADRLAARAPLLYVSGEESAAQIGMRAARLGIARKEILLLAENHMGRILDTIAKTDPRFVILDSIQTAYTENAAGAPGSVSQVRECAMELLAEGKGNDRTIVLVGHVTKSGSLAGPRVLEHMVDTVLYLEGDKNQEFRILRAEKNRFGSTREIGVFEMGADGLSAVENPATRFLAPGREPAPGVVVFPALEGSRVFLLEVQALGSRSAFGNPRRLSAGYDAARLLLMAAILEKKTGLALSSQDLYVNIAGGMKLTETAADLAVCLAIVSSLHDRILDPRTVVLGEIGLGGEVRPVPQLARRLSEAARMGYVRALVPAESIARGLGAEGIELAGVGHIGDAVRLARTGRDSKKTREKNDDGSGGLD